MMEKQLFASVRKVKHEIDHNMGTLLKEIAQACRECDIDKYSINSYVISDVARDVDMFTSLLWIWCRRY